MIHTAENTVEFCEIDDQNDLGVNRVLNRTHRMPPVEGIGIFQHKTRHTWILSAMKGRGMFGLGGQVNLLSLNVSIIPLVVIANRKGEPTPS